MRVSEIMTRRVVAVMPGTTLREAARRMRDADLGALPVAADGRLLGIITDRDIAVRGLAGGADPDVTPVEAAMSQRLLCASPDQEVSEAAGLMEREQVRRLPVVDQDHRLVGILSLADVARRAGDPILAAELIRDLSEQI